jgi:hypothetical protein
MSIIVVVQKHVAIEIEETRQLSDQHHTPFQILLFPGASVNRAIQKTQYPQQGRPGYLCHKKRNSNGLTMYFPQSLGFIIPSLKISDNWYFYEYAGGDSTIRGQENPV